jgi:hypothetical protein
MTVRELAEILHLSQRQIYKLAQIPGSHVQDYPFGFTTGTFRMAVA